MTTTTGSGRRTRDGFGLTLNQLEIMDYLWRRGSSTVREAKRAVGDGRAYTSVLTIFQTLEENGWVYHEQEGKAYRYYPSVDPGEAAKLHVDAIREVAPDFAELIGGEAS